MGDPECRWEMRPDADWPEGGIAAALRDAFAASPQSVARRLEEQLELVRRQGEELAAMGVPVIEVWDRVLAVPVIGVVDQARAAVMMEALLARIAGTGARCAILDLTGVTAMDRETAGHLMRMIAAARLLGGECLVSGISQATARTMTELGIGIDIRSFSTLKLALRHAIRGAGG